MRTISLQGNWYHKNCFRCHECNRMLDSLTNNDGPDGELYCKKCYKDKYGPQTRSSDIDHKLIDLSNIKSEDASKNCPRYVILNRYQTHCHYYFLIMNFIISINS